MPYFGSQVTPEAPSSSKQSCLCSCRALKVDKRPYIWFTLSLNLRCFSFGISIKQIHHVDTSHSTTVMVRYFSFNGRWFVFEVKIFICNTLLQLLTTWRIITAATACYHFVFKSFIPPKMFHGLLTQQFWYPFKLFYCLIDFYMRRRSSFL